MKLLLWVFCLPILHYASSWMLRSLQAPLTFRNSDAGHENGIEATRGRFARRTGPWKEQGPASSSSRWCRSIFFLTLFNCNSNLSHGDLLAWTCAASCGKKLSDRDLGHGSVRKCALAFLRFQRFVGILRASNFEKMLQIGFNWQTLKLSLARVREAFRLCIWFCHMISLSKIKSQAWAQRRDNWVTQTVCHCPICSLDDVVIDDLTRQCVLRLPVKPLFSALESLTW